MSVEDSLSKSQRTFFKITKKMADLSDYPMQHLGAVVVNKHKVISTGYNSNTKCHHIQKSIDEHRYGCSCAGKVHAEVSALLPLIKKRTDLSNATMYIGRYYKDGTTALAKPCEGCMGLLKECGIKRIYYTTPSGYTKLTIG